MDISIIIPTLNEAQKIGTLIQYLQKLPEARKVLEIIIVDGGSDDNTIEMAKEKGAKVIATKLRHRAKQMNYGARQARASILYFLHADVFPPQSCIHDILQSIKHKNCFGCFAYKLDTQILWLKIHGFMTQFNLASTGGGDQSLFIKREDFEAIGGFDEELPIMEDFDFVWKTKRKFPFCVLKKRALVSARRYEQYGYWKIFWIDFIVFFGFRLGRDPKQLAQWYRKQLNK